MTRLNDIFKPYVKEVNEVDTRERINSSAKSIVNKYAYFDDLSNQYYASVFWTKLIDILDPEQNLKFQSEYQDKVPLEIMVRYTQEQFLRKRDQRWSLENYHDFDVEIKKRLDSLLNEHGQMLENPMPEQAEIALFLGTSTQNLCKRAFYIFDSIVKRNTTLNTVIILGNDEPYDRFMGDISKVVALYPDYFRAGLLVEDVPKKATMHETMVFVFENLNWPAGVRPATIKMSLKHPCNTGHEVAAVNDYLRANHPQLMPSSALSQAEPTSKMTIAVVSNQPFNDRQALTALGAFSKSNLTAYFVVEATGPGVDNYPLLNSMPTSVMSAAQIVDNLSRTLYEINQTATALLQKESPLLYKTRKPDNFLKQRQESNTTMAMNCLSTQKPLVIHFQQCLQMDGDATDSLKTKKNPELGLSSEEITIKSNQESTSITTNALSSSVIEIEEDVFYDCEVPGDDYDIFLMGDDDLHSRDLPPTSQLKCFNADHSLTRIVVKRCSTTTEDFAELKEDFYECQTYPERSERLCFGKKTLFQEFPTQPKSVRSQTIRGPSESQINSESNVLFTLGYTAAYSAAFTATSEFIGDAFHLLGYASKASAEKIKLITSLAPIFYFGSWQATGVSWCTNQFFKTIGLSEVDARLAGQGVGLAINLAQATTPVGIAQVGIAIATVAVSVKAGKYGFWAEKRLIECLTPHDQPDSSPSVITP